MLRGEIGLADLLIVLKDLKPDPTRQKEIIELLGFFDLHQAQTQFHNPKKTSDQTPVSSEESTTQRNDSESESSSDDARPSQNLNFRLQRIGTLKKDSIPPDWIEQPNDFIDKEENQMKLARKPLFTENTYRAILSVSLGTLQLSSQFDVQRTTEKIVKNRVCLELPRIYRSTLNQGCQLLLDCSDSMIPYWEDLDDLANQARNVVGIERLRIYKFTDNPFEAMCWASDQQWQTERGCPVVVASHLNPSMQFQFYKTKTIKKWKEFIQKCEEAKVPLIIFTPWHPRLLSDWIGDYPIQIFWSPQNTAAAIRQLVGKGHKVKL